jgi:hypothetical protein
MSAALATFKKHEGGAMENTTGYSGVCDFNIGTVRSGLDHDECQTSYNASLYGDNGTYGDPPGK